MPVCSDVRAHAHATLGGATVLDIAGQDTDGRLLRLHTGPTDAPAVDALEMTLGPIVVRLEVLAASHRVSVRRRDGEAWEVIETVACGGHGRPVDTAALPSRHDWSDDGWTMRFTSGLAKGDAALAAAVAAIEPLVGHPAALVARFPGHDDALTALVVDTDDGHASSDSASSAGAASVRWRTWHLYPGADPHVVETATAAACSSGSVER